VSSFTVGGLASGLDSNTIITQLLQIERRPIDLLNQQRSAAAATKTSIGSLEGKLATLRAAAAKLQTVAKVRVGAATSSDEGVLTAAAGEGAARGSATLTVTRLARASAAGSTVGVASAAAAVAAAAGTFKFQVGSGAVQSVDVDATTTLSQLAAKINDLDAGVTAIAVNLGTATSPDWRLQVQSRATGADGRITVVRDDTSLAVQTSQAGQDAQFTVAGFASPFTRATNTFSDVIPGVTLTLRAEGTSTVTVADDTDATVAQVQALVDAFNDIVGFVNDQSKVSQAAEGATVQVGSLATDQSVRRLLTRLHDLFSQPVAGATTRYVNLSSVGLATQRDGTIALDGSKLRAALADDPDAVAQLFAGNGTATGTANDLVALADQATRAGGLLDARTGALDDQLRSIDDQIAVAERRVTAVEADLRRQFAALESLVGQLQSQSNFLAGALGGR
jgi:flagellar hook-associated protein 2